MKDIISKTTSNKTKGTKFLCANDSASFSSIRKHLSKSQKDTVLINGCKFTIVEKKVSRGKDSGRKYLTVELNTVDGAELLLGEDALRIIQQEVNRRCLLIGSDSNRSLPEYRLSVFKQALREEFAFTYLISSPHYSTREEPTNKSNEATSK